ncbi:hypothetical protein Tcan_09099 [Toxocara canis]|uniref:Uncharacterized protein n=1 Tax=Toxocara canis TaxID=6265 RepID=A0A0B2UV72_TOXCA|nr:hypothetical protein Tcan_09099 [Toxocara canis]
MRIVNSAIQLWWSELANYSVPAGQPPKHNRDYGHFLQVSCFSECLSDRGVIDAGTFGPSSIQVLILTYGAVCETSRESLITKHPTNTNSREPGKHPFGTTWVRPSQCFMRERRLKFSNRLQQSTPGFFFAAPLTDLPS